MTENDPGRSPDEPDGTPPAGRMRFQDETTTPREPTLAERRAREQTALREREAEEQRAADAERSRTTRKRVLIGAGVTVGVVALIAVGYAVAQPDEEIEAQCVDENNVVVDDANCVTPASTNGTSYGGGFFPIFIGLGGAQYHYNYGGTGAVGQTAVGGTTTVPRDGTRVRTPSGSKTVSRGGLGVSSSSGGSGGKVGGSSSGGSSGGKSSGG